MKPGLFSKFIIVICLGNAVFLSVNSFAATKSHSKFLDALSEVKTATAFDQPHLLQQLKEQYPTEFTDDLWRESQQAVDFRLNALLQRNSENDRFAEAIEKVYQAKLQLDPKAVPDLLSQALHDLDAAKDPLVREKLLTELLKFDTLPRGLIKAVNESRQNASLTEKLLVEAISNQGAPSTRTTLETLYPFAKQIQEVKDSKTRELILKKLNIHPKKLNAAQALLEATNGGAPSRLIDLQREFAFKLSDLSLLPLKDRARFGAQFYEKSHSSTRSPDWAKVAQPSDTEWNQFLSQAHSDLDQSIHHELALKQPSQDLRDFYRLKVELANDAFPESLSSMMKSLPVLEPDHQSALLSEIKNAKKLPENAWASMAETVGHANTTSREQIRGLIVKRFAEIPDHLKNKRSASLSSVLLKKDFNAEELEIWSKLVPEKEIAPTLSQITPELFARKDVIYTDEVLGRISTLLRESKPLQDEVMPSVIKALADHPTAAGPNRYFASLMEDWLRAHPAAITRFSHHLDRFYPESILNQLRYSFDSEQMKALIVKSGEFTSADGYQHILAVARKELQQTTLASRKPARDRLLAEIDQILKSPVDLTFEPNCLRNLLKNL
jgi:hypothetical protein